MSRASRPATSRNPASSAGSSSRVMLTPEAPDAIRNTQSFVEHSPSTVMALKVSSTTRRSAPARIAGSTFASVVRNPSIVAMRGSIMPEPLAIPPTVNDPPPGTSTSAAADFGNGSVVMIARVAFSAPVTSRTRTAAWTPERIFAGSSCTPITPVDATSTRSLVHPVAEAAASAISRATRIPASPVHALAHPLLTTIVFACPPDRVRCSRESTTGAATA